MEKVSAPIPGIISSVAIKEGQIVKAGQLLLVLDAMKMQNEIFSSEAGTVKSIYVKEGDKVAVNQLMIVIK